MTAVARGAIQARNSTLLLLETTERRPAIVPTQIVRTLKTNMVKAVIFKPWLFLLPNLRSQLLKVPPSSQKTEWQKRKPRTRFAAKRVSKLYLKTPTTIQVIWTISTHEKTRQWTQVRPSTKETPHNNQNLKTSRLLAEISKMLKISKTLRTSELLLTINPTRLTWKRLCSERDNNKIMVEIILQITMTSLTKTECTT